MTDRSITFCNSRILPGQDTTEADQGSFCSPPLKALSSLSCRNDQLKYSTSRGMSSLRCPQRRNLNREKLRRFKRGSLRNMPTAMEASRSRFRSGNHPNIGLDGYSSTDTLEFMFMQNTQQSDLRLGRSYPTSSRKIVPSFGQPRSGLNAAESLPVKAPFSWPTNNSEAIKVARDGCAVHTHECV